MPPLSPLRTVHAAFTAHGSCNSKLIFVLTNSALTSACYLCLQPICHCRLRAHTAVTPLHRFPSQIGFYPPFHRELPYGSLPAFAWDDVSTPIPTITARHSLFRHHLPTGHSAFVTIGLPPLSREETYGLTKFRKHDFVRFRTRLSTGGATSV